MAIHKHDNQANIDVINQNLDTTASPSVAGLTVSGLTTANGIVQTNGSGVLSSSVTLPDGTLATTQSANDNSTKLATTAYADAAAIAGSVSWELDTGWVARNDNTLYTIAHSISMTFPADILEIRIYWRVNSGGSYGVPIEYTNEIQDGDICFLSYDGTNIYIKNISGWGKYVDSAGTTNLICNNGELRILARKIV